MAVPAGPDKQIYDVPAGSKDQEIIIQTRDLKDGETISPHIHHGVEMTEVVTGTFELYVKGQPMKVIHAGESFLVPREAPHDAARTRQPAGASGRDPGDRQGHRAAHAGDRCADSEEIESKHRPASPFARKRIKGEGEASDQAGRTKHRERVSAKQRCEG